MREPVGRLFPGAGDVDAVVASAEQGFQTWRRFSVDERLGWMHKFREALLAEREHLIEALMWETGKNRGVAEDDFDKLQKGLHFFPIEMKNLAGELLHDTEGDAEHKITYAPIGPVVAKIVAGGPNDLGDAYVTPHLLVGLTPDNPIFAEEIFGPVIGVYLFDDDDEVLELANRTDAGLASYVFTTSMERASRFSRELEFGEVMVNGAKWDIHLPHIGIKNSGVGLDCSKFALHDYLFMKRVTTSIEATARRE